MATQATSEDPTKARAYFEPKMAFTTGPVDLERMMKSNAVTVVDVRAAEDFAEGHIPGGVNLPKDQWQTLKGLHKDKTNVLYCYLLFPGLSSRCGSGGRVCRQGLSCYGIGRSLALVEGRRFSHRNVKAS